MIWLKSKLSILSLLQVYVSDSSKSDKECKYICCQLQNHVDTIPKENFVVVLGDFNAILENDTSQNKNIMGKFGIVQINRSGGRLIESQAREENNLVVS